jgi:hypothetical protein
MCQGYSRRLSSGTRYLFVRNFLEVSSFRTSRFDFRLDPLVPLAIETPHGGGPFLALIATGLVLLFSILVAIALI